MPGPLIDVYEQDKSPFATYYKEQFAPWVESGGPSTWNKKPGTYPPDVPGGMSEEQNQALIRLLLAAFGGAKMPAYNRFSNTLSEKENRKVHGPGLAKILERIETP